MRNLSRKQLSNNTERQRQSRGTVGWKAICWAWGRGRHSGVWSQTVSGRPWPLSKGRNYTQKVTLSSRAPAAHDTLTTHYIRRRAPGCGMPVRRGR